MPDKVCVDASLVLKILTPEEYSAETLALWQVWAEDDTETIAPPFFEYEVLSVLRQKVAIRRETSQEEAQEALDVFFDLGVTLQAPEDLSREAWSLALDLDRPTVYDTAYMALAKMQDCEFWTADRRLYNAVKDKIDFIRWIGDYQVNR